MSVHVRARLSGVLVAVLLGFTLYALPARAQEATTWKALAGGSSRDQAITLAGFYPREFVIGVGDTVSWEVTGAHSITLPGGGQSLPPFLVEQAGAFTYDPRALFPYGGRVYDGSKTVSSGVALGGRTTYSVTFKRPGRWTVFCLQHTWTGRGMEGTVVVTSRPRLSPAQVFERAKREQAAAIQKGLAYAATLAPERDGKRVTLPIVSISEPSYSVLRFLAKPLVVRRGTTVTWTMRDAYEYHTVTFPGRGKIPELIVREGQGAAARLRINPLLAAQTTAKTYDGQGFVNSGLMAPAWTLHGVSDFSLTFTRPGRYEYVCVVHEAQGMKGVVIVR